MHQEETSLRSDSVVGGGGGGGGGGGEAKRGVKWQIRAERQSQSMTAYSYCFIVVAYCSQNMKSFTRNMCLALENLRKKDGECVPTGNRTQHARSLRSSFLRFSLLLVTRNVR